MVGASLSYAGFRRWSERATVLLIAAANAPDVDIVAAFMGRNLEWRRGLTHGVPALVLWPFVLAVIFRLAERGRPDRTPFRRLVIMGAAGVFTHPSLDYLNTYGLRWLMPAVDRWYYGDTLFIVDPWLYLMLGVGLWLSRRGYRAGVADPFRWARTGLFASACYIGFMMGSMLLVRDALEAGSPPSADLMVAPVAVNPFMRTFVVSAGDDYRVGRFSIPSWRVTDEARIPKGDLTAARGELAKTRPGRAFLHWSRFPAARSRDGAIQVFDLRYSAGKAGDWAAVTVTPAGGSR